MGKKEHSVNLGERLAAKLAELSLAELTDKKSSKLQAISLEFSELSGPLQVLLDVEIKRIIDDMVLRGCNNPQSLTAELREAGVSEFRITKAVDAAREMRLKNLDK